MFQRSTLLTRGIFCGLLVILICSSSATVIGRSTTSEELSEESSTIQIIQKEIPFFGGINSIRAVIGNSSIGVLYPKENNPQNLYLFTTFSQKVANIEIYNQRGVLAYRDDLILRNTFIMSLLSLNEFVDENNNSLMDPLESITRKRIDLIDVPFIVSEQTSISNDSVNEVSYRIIFTASDIEYLRPQGTLEDLSFLFEFSLQKKLIKLPNIPTISIRRSGRQLSLSKNIIHENLDAICLTPRLKFSCNISGWDYQYSNSKLMLKVESLFSEQIFRFANFTDISISSDMLKATGLLGRLKFDTDLTNNITIDHDSSMFRNYENQRFLNSRFSVGNSIREFLNFTWSQVASVNGEEEKIIFQPLRFEPRNVLRNLLDIPFISLTGGFIFPQGTEIYYDPEIQVIEINPLIEFLQVPNRSILQDNSAIVLVSGFFVGVIIIVRSRTIKRKNQ